MEKLALLGGSPLIPPQPKELLGWPRVTPEDEEAVLSVLRRGAMSDTDVTAALEEEFAQWNGRKYALAYCNGTLSLLAAMFAIGLGEGDELICQNKTYWASCIQAMQLGATVAFADINPHSLCIEPEDIERVIGPNTKAIMVVHYLGHPADMDAIMAIANRHGLAVIEDVSHAQGGLYKGRKLGTFGQIAAMSLMSGKSFATGEMGMLITDDKRLRDRALAFSHYERNNERFIDTQELQPYFGIPLGGMKGRVNQLASAMGRVQLKSYDARCAVIRQAMNRFWDLLDGVPGVEAHRVSEHDGSNMAGWYSAHGIYHPEQLGGLPLGLFCEALRAEGSPGHPGGNRPLHMHPYMQTYKAPGAEKPLRIAHAKRDVRELDRDLPVTNDIQVYSVPWFKTYMPDNIALYAQAVRKVVAQADDLIALGRKEDASGRLGRWFFYGA